MSGSVPVKAIALKTAAPAFLTPRAEVVPVPVDLVYRHQRRPVQSVIGHDAAVINI